MDLSLDVVRLKLIKLEDDIISATVTRCKSSFFNKDYESIFISFMKNLEETFDKLNFYSKIERIPFFLDKDIFKNIQYSVNNEIYLYYTNIFLSNSDNIQGVYDISNFLNDIELLQLLSLRIHLGIHVAIAKYNQDKEGYQGLINKQNDKGIMTLLTDVATEEKVVERVYYKARHYSSLHSKEFSDNISEFCKDMYLSFIIPSTKKVELYYLLNKYKIEIS